jgi:hypothetical protein
VEDSRTEMVELPLGAGGRREMRLAVDETN